MSQQSGPRSAFNIDKIKDLHYEDLTLTLNSTYLYSDAKTLGFEYKVMIGDTQAGVLTTLINDNLELHQADGNLGLKLDKQFLNKDIPFKATKASFDLYKHFDQTQITITFEKENGSINQMCEQLSGRYLDTIQVVDGNPRIRHIIDCR